MQAIVHDRYGDLDVLDLREVPVREPGRGQVRVRVHAAAVHVGDLFAVKGSPFPVRLMMGLRRPKVGIPGFDVAGTVDAVGPDVTGLRPGDAVLGSAEGSCAEYAIARVEHLVLKPASMSWADAAALPTSGLAALHGIRDAGAVRPGQEVLVIGASGGVGVYAVQIARALGGRVTAVCSGGNAELVRGLGADAVIDYTREDPAASGRRWDVILDNVEDRPLAEVRRLLADDGILVLNSGTGASGLGMLVRLIRPLVVSRFSRQALRRFLSNPRQADLATLVAMVERGELRPVVGATYALPDTARALGRIEGGHATGKQVILVEAAAGVGRAAPDGRASICAQHRLMVL